MTDLGRIGFVNKGGYKSDEPYEKLDIVKWNSCIYCCVKSTMGNEPTSESEFWQLWLDPKASGVTGIKGENEEEFRTGEVVITAENIGAVANDDFATTTKAGIMRVDGETSYLDENNTLKINPKFNVDLQMDASSNNALANSVVTSEIAKIKAIFGTTYDSDVTYKKNDIRLYDNEIYRALADIDVPEEFNPAHWQLTSFDIEVSKLLQEIEVMANADTVSYNAETKKLSLLSGEDVLSETEIPSIPVSNEQNIILPNTFSLDAIQNNPSVVGSLRSEAEKFKYVQMLYNYKEYGDTSVVKANAAVYNDFIRKYDITVNDKATKDEALAFADSVGEYGKAIVSTWGISDSVKTVLASYHTANSLSNDILNIFDTTEENIKKLYPVIGDLYIDKIINDEALMDNFFEDLKILKCITTDTQCGTSYEMNDLDKFIASPYYSSASKKSTKYIEELARRSRYDLYKDNWYVSHYYVLNRDTVNGQYIDSKYGHRILVDGWGTSSSNPLGAIWKNKGEYTRFEYKLQGFDFN